MTLQPMNTLGNDINKRNTPINAYLSITPIILFIELTVINSFLKNSKYMVIILDPAGNGTLQWSMHRGQWSHSPWCFG